jgi:hypothetical protein
MSIYSDTLQQLTDQLVTDVTALNTLVNSTPTDWQAITTAANTVSTDASNFDQAIKSADIPPSGTMVLDLSTELLSEVSDLNNAITANDITNTTLITSTMVETTMNINRCVTRMAETQVTPPDPNVVTPLPPWMAVPTTPPPDGGS